MLIPILEIIISAALVTLILLQERSSGLSGIFGGGDGGGGIYQTRRGLEKAIFVSTIILAACFVGLAVIQLLY